MLAAPLLAAGRALAGESGTTLLAGTEPGSAGDTWAGAFIPFLERHARLSGIRLQRLPGDGGLEAARRLAAAAADGRTIGAFTLPNLILRAAQAREPHLLDRLRAAGSVARAPLALVTAPGPGATLQDLRAGSAGAILATPPAGGAAAEAGQQLRAMIPRLSVLDFPSAAAARRAAQSGHVAAALLPLPAVIEAVREEQLVVLGLAEPERISLLPDAPTLRESGMEVLAAQRRGFLLPAGVAVEPLRAIEQALLRCSNDPEFADQASTMGYVPEFRASLTCQNDMAALRQQVEGR